MPRLIDALKHKNLRAQAAHILGGIGAAAAPAAEALAKLAGDADVRPATEAALALAKIGPEAKAAVPALAAALRQKDNPNAHAIVYALGKIGPAAVAAEPAILESMKSQDRSLAVLRRLGLDATSSAVASDHRAGHCPRSSPASTIPCRSHVRPPPKRSAVLGRWPRKLSPR